MIKDPFKTRICDAFEAIFERVDIRYGDGAGGGHVFSGEKAE